MCITGKWHRKITGVILITEFCFSIGYIGKKYYRLWSYRLVHGKWNLLVTDILSMSDIFKKHVLLFYIVSMSLGVLGCSNYTCIEFPLSFQSTSYKPHKLCKELQFAKSNAYNTNNWPLSNLCSDKKVQI